MRLSSAILSFVLFFISSLVPFQVHCAKILFFVGITTYSHRVSMWPLVTALAERGHEITFISAHPPKALANPNVTEIIPKSLLAMTKQFENSNLLDIRLSGKDGSETWQGFMELSLASYDLLGKDEEFLKWVETANFDLVIVDALFSDIGIGLAYKWKAKVGVFCTTNPYMFMSDDYGIPTESSWLPDMQIRYLEEDDMSLVQRIFNSVRPIYWHLLRSWYFFPRVERVLHEDFGLKDMPRLSELHKNTSLVLTNSHYSEEYAKALPPFVIPVAGMHCFQGKDTTAKELQTFMDGTAAAGFIYVSFGSAAKLSLLPPEIQQVFFTAMKNSNTKFLVKWNGDVPKDMPSNVFTSSWLPQQKVLAHPNIKGFITHGGLLGIQEAMCSGVPMIVLPIFGEQDYNGNRVHRRRRGIKLDLYGITAEKLTNAISALLADPSYRRNMEEASQLFLDRPETAVNTGVWWIEYVLRRSSVDFMKPLGRYQTWYQRRLIDVWLTLALVPFVILLIMLRILKLFRSTSNASKMTSKKTN